MSTTGFRLSAHTAAAFCTMVTSRTVRPQRWWLRGLLVASAIVGARCGSTVLGPEPQTLAGTYSYTATFGDGAPLATGRLTLLDDTAGALRGTLRLAGACRRPDQTPVDCVVVLTGAQGSVREVRLDDGQGWRHEGQRRGRGQLEGTWVYQSQSEPGQGLFRGTFTASLIGPP